MNLIVAVDKNWGIGKEGKLLCSIPGDLKNFKEKTSGKVVVMGRSTLESLPGGKPLKNRTNIILTHRTDFSANGAEICHSIEELLEKVNAYPSDDVFIIGGESLYNGLMEFCDKLYVTKIDMAFDADRFIKNADELPMFKLKSESEPVTENGITYRFTEYTRTRVK